MKINFNQPLVNFEGEPIKDEKGILTFSKQIGNILFQSQDKETPLETYELAKKVYFSQGDEEFTISEVEKIKGKVKEMFLAGFAGQALEIIAKSSVDHKK